MQKIGRFFRYIFTILALYGMLGFLMAIMPEVIEMKQAQKGPDAKVTPATINPVEQREDKTQMEPVKALELTKQEKNKEIRGHRKIVKGDTLWKIAQDCEMRVYHVIETNGLTSNKIYPDDILVIPNLSWRGYVGKMSWFGPGFHGKLMGNLKVYDQEKVLIAHRTFPKGMWVLIININNGKHIVAQVEDGGPYTIINGKYDREVDLSKGAAKKLSTVKLEKGKKIFSVIDKGIVPGIIIPLPNYKGRVDKNCPTEPLNQKT